MEIYRLSNKLEKPLELRYPEIKNTISNMFLENNIYLLDLYSSSKELYIIFYNLDIEHKLKDKFSIVISRTLWGPHKRLTLNFTRIKLDWNLSKNLIIVGSYTTFPGYIYNGYFRFNEDSEDEGYLHYSPEDTKIANIISEVIKVIYGNKLDYISGVVGSI